MRRFILNPCLNYPVSILETAMSSLKKLVIGVSSALWIGLVGSAAYGLPASEVETTYFSDKTLQNEIGSSILSCSGNRYHSGRTSRFVATSRTPCNTPGIPSVYCSVDGVRTLCPPNICSSELFHCL